MADRKQPLEGATGLLLLHCSDNRCICDDMARNLGKPLSFWGLTAIFSHLQSRNDRGACFILQRAIRKVSVSTKEGVG
jgi:hypothetical protein